MSDTWTPAEQLASAEADVRALLVILSRHRLTALERATVTAIAGRHGHALPQAAPEVSCAQDIHLVGSLVDDPARIRPDDSPELIAELSRLRDPEVSPMAAHLAAGVALDDLALALVRRSES